VVNNCWLVLSHQLIDDALHPARIERNSVDEVELLPNAWSALTHPLQESEHDTALASDALG
jgi:hypothetical protein